MRIRLILTSIVLCLFACTKKETTITSISGPPTRAEIEGSYAVAWSVGNGLVLSGQAIINQDAVHFTTYPCFPAGAETIGGGYDYSEDDGSFACEVKTPDGTAKLTLIGTFTTTTLEGSYLSQVLSATCESGAVRMDRQL